ncbi:MAG TPA: CvpA family protein [Verrucomicrobiae bacterium]|jgi:uncharacterized membrane protein required for colicin V production
MIVAVIHKTAWTDNLTHLTLGAFDLLLICFLLVGFWRGRKNGMSKEALLVSKWVIMVAACSLGYAWVGDFLIQIGFVKNVFDASAQERTAGYITGYLLIMAVVTIIFSYLKKVFREKISGSNTFGSWEYYLGMVAGIIRYACMAITALALINAPVYSDAELAAQKEYNHQTYGGGAQGFSGDLIPSFDELQASVFKKSLLGPLIKNNLGALLINTQGVGKYRPATHPSSATHPGN